MQTWAKLLGITVVAMLAGCGAQEMSFESPDRSDAVDGCTDIAPDDEFTCGEQVGWGKCDEGFMDGFCDRSCGRCSGIGDGAQTCVDGTCPISSQLIDPDASAATRELMSYLVSQHGSKILSGQQNREDADHMAQLTGRFPAIVGFDLMDYSPSRVERGTSSEDIDLALDWWTVNGGIVTLSWHWNAPSNLVDTEETPWWKGFYTNATTFDLPKAIDDRDSTERQLLIRDIDAIAVQLQRLEDQGVPVLWRPIHEASGEWFWWGAHGPRIHKALWRLLYDRLANHHKLNNLIWVWNGQAADWYPGDQYVDIVAEDIYDGELDHNPQEERFRTARDFAGVTKLVALSETGALLDPIRLEASAANWSWFMLWSGHFAQEQEWNTDATKRAVYESDFVLTLDELPVFGN